MKFLMFLLVVSACSMKPVMAGSGKAIVPHWFGEDSSSRSTIVYVSNISSNDVNVSVTFFNDDGNVIAATTITNLINGNSQLESKTTGQFQIQPSSKMSGYAIIEWSNINGDEDAVALIAHGLRVVVSATDRRSDIAVPINNGLVF